MNVDMNVSIRKNKYSAVECGKRCIIAQLTQGGEIVHRRIFIAVATLLFIEA